MAPERQYNGSYTVAQRLLPRHYAIQDLYLANVPVKEIAERVSMTTRNVYNIINSPSFQHELAIRRSKIETQCEDNIVASKDSVHEALRKQTMEAVNRLTDLMTSDNDSVARQAANDILDRAGYPKVTRTEGSQTQTISIDEETAKRLESVLLELRKEGT